MLTRYGQSRADGLSPMPRGSYSGQHLRVSDAERQAVTGRLSQHFGDGRLDQADSGERAGRTMSATSQAGLPGDLPDTWAPALPGQPPRRNRHPVLLIALIVVAAIAAAHAVLGVTVPLLWLAFGVVAVVMPTRVLEYSRSGQHR